MDPRAEVRGLNKLEAARRDYQKLQGAIAGLPAAFHSVSNHNVPAGFGAAPRSVDRSTAMSAQAVIDLCRNGYAEDLRRVKEAVAVCCEHADEIMVSYKWPKDEGNAVDSSYKYNFWSRDLTDALKRMEAALSPLGAAVAAYDKVCRLADELEAAVKDCPTHFGHSLLQCRATSYHDARAAHLGKARQDLVTATGSLSSAVWGALHQSDPQGLLNSIDAVWAKIPKAEAAAQPNMQPAVSGNVVPLENVPRFRLQVDSIGKPCLTWDGGSVVVKSAMKDFLTELNEKGTGTARMEYVNALLDSVPVLNQHVRARGKRRKDGTADYAAPSLKGRIECDPAVVPSVQ